MITLVLLALDIFGADATPVPLVESVPSTMRAAVASGPGKSGGDWSTLSVDAAHKVPSCGSSQVLIKVAGSSVNPVVSFDQESS